jgi:two-component system, NtrC family, nitrogen regulation sensor histidine kinase GlnL
MNSYTFTVDNELRINLWNEDAEAITGKLHSEVLGLPYFKVLPRITNGRSDAVSQVLKESTSKTLNGYQIACFCGSEEADINLQPIYDVSGVSTGVAVTIDAHPVCSLSRRLEKSQQLVDIGKSASSLAHGVRNPLNAIKGAVVYLKDRFDSDTTFLEFSHIIEEEITRLEKFITEFLGTSDQKNDVAEVNINSILDRVVKLTFLQAKNKDIHIICDHGTLPPVRIHLFQFEHAILNLVNNALEAMQRDGSITLRTATSQRFGRDSILIEIIDTGPGMSRRNINGILAPSKPKANNMGKGFGLFITREVIQHHGGELEIVSEKNVGTTIRIFLPVQHHQEAVHG